MSLHLSFSCVIHSIPEPLTHLSFFRAFVLSSNATFGEFMVNDFCLHIVGCFLFDQCCHPSKNALFTQEFVQCVVVCHCLVWFNVVSKQVSFIDFWVESLVVSFQPGMKWLACHFCHGREFRWCQCKVNSSSSSCACGEVIILVLVFHASTGLKFVVNAFVVSPSFSVSFQSQSVMGVTSACFSSCSVRNALASC